MGAPPLGREVTHLASVCAPAAPRSNYKRAKVQSNACLSHFLTDPYIRGAGHTMNYAVPADVNSVVERLGFTSPRADHPLVCAVCRRPTRGRATLTRCGWLHP